MRAKLFRPHQHVLNSISFIISVLLLSLFIPRHNAKHDTSMYNACNETVTYACGPNIGEEIGFPFWEVGIQSPDCELEGFELSCDGSDLFVDIAPNIKYHVVEFDLSAKALQVKPDDNLLEHLCKPDFIGSIPQTIWSWKLYYGQKTNDLHLYYNCSSEAKTPTYLYPICSNEDEHPVYIYPGNPSPQAEKELNSCSHTILPVNGALFEGYKVNSGSAEELLRSSFEVYYNTTTDQKACKDCEKDGGFCWIGTYPGSTDTCLFPESDTKGTNPNNPDNTVLNQNLYEYGHNTEDLTISFIISVLLLSLFIPTHNAKHDTKLYKACNETVTYACGKPIREGIGFPFWGVGIRSRDCGLPGFELSCEESGLAVDIGSSIKYHVVGINSSAKPI